MIWHITVFAAFVVCANDGNRIDGPYWESYSYNAENDLTGETSTPASGAATTISNGSGGRLDPAARGQLRADRHPVWAMSSWC